jgi:membrane protein insertase Oxa1/YidC/SpoIIIJ
MAICLVILFQMPTEPNILVFFGKVLIGSLVLSGIYFVLNRFGLIPKIRM